MAGKKQQKDQLRSYLDSLGLHGDYLSLIDAAVRGDWGVQQFVTRVTHTETFRNTFPGLVEHGGTIANGLSGQEGTPVTASSLGSAIRNYRTLQNSYQQIANRYGYGKVSKQLMAAQIKSQVSPDEFLNRLRAIRTIQQNPGIEASFNAYLKQSGQAPLDREGLYKLAAGTHDKRFYDYYEAAQLKAANIGLSKEQSLGVAKRIGEPGTTIPLTEVIARVRENLGTIGPELAQQGISTVALTKFLANPTAPDPSGLAGKLTQLVATRKGLAGSYVAGIQSRKGPGGGLAEYGPDAAASYG